MPFCLIFEAWLAAAGDISFSADYKGVVRIFNLPYNTIMLTFIELKFTASMPHNVRAILEVRPNGQPCPEL